MCLQRGSPRDSAGCATEPARSCGRVCSRDGTGTGRGGEAVPPAGLTRLSPGEHRRGCAPVSRAPACPPPGWGNPAARGPPLRSPPRSRSPGGAARPAGGRCPPRLGAAGSARGARPEAGPARPGPTHRVIQPCPTARPLSDPPAQGSPAAASPPRRRDRGRFPATGRWCRLPGAPCSPPSSPPGWPPRAGERGPSSGRGGGREGAPGVGAPRGVQDCRG